MTKTIEAHHQAVMEALTQLKGRVEDMSPILAAIGDDSVERIKQRFATATGPDGARWKPNAQSTLMNYLQKKGGFSKKTGKITAKGQQLAIAKRPLQGETWDLARQFFSNATGNELAIGSSMIYAAMQHFGGKKSEFPKLWGDIPGRAFMPITPSGELVEPEATEIVSRIRQYLEG